MKEPEKPHMPHEWEFITEFSEEIMLHKHYVHTELFEDYLYNQKARMGWQEGDVLPNIEEFGYDNEVCTLADLIKKVPTGVLPSNVIISLKRDREMSYVEVVVSARKPTNKAALEDKYKEALKEYRLKLDQYQLDVIAYQSWKAQEDIRKKEQEIANLKEQLAKLKK